MMTYQLVTPSIRINRAIWLTTMTRQHVSLAITYAKRQLDEVGSNNWRMVYQRMIVDWNEGDKYPDKSVKTYTSKWDKETGTTKSKCSTNTRLLNYVGLPCLQCRRLIPLGSRCVRRRAGNCAKYLHISCYEMLYKTRVPLISEAEKMSERLSLYPTVC